MSLHIRVLQFAFFALLHEIPWRDVNASPLTVRNLSNATERIASLTADLSVSGVEEALSLLNNLTSSQREIWELQRLRQEELKKKNEIDEQREEKRTKTLEEEHRLINEMRGKISRKLKSMSRTSPAAYLNSEFGATSNIVRPKDCADIYLNAEETSGVYLVWPTWKRDGQGFLVYCDMDTNEGGWTVIRRWGNDIFSDVFYKKPWHEYKVGFGNIRSDFWLGNDLVHALTNQDSYEVRFDVQTLFANQSSTYRRFWIDNEFEKYKVHVEYINLESAGDLMRDHNGAPFSASDKNNIESKYPSHYECSFGWWYKSNCNVNEKLKPWSVSGSMQKEMKIRPIDFIKRKEAS